MILPRCFQSSGCFSYMWVLIGLFFLPDPNPWPTSTVRLCPNGMIPPKTASCCVSLFLPLLFHIDCFHLTTLHGAPTWCCLCILDTPPLMSVQWFSHISDDFPAMFPASSPQPGSRGKQMWPRNQLPRRQRCLPLPPWHCPKPPLPLPPPPVAPRQRRLPLPPWHCPKPPLPLPPPPVAPRQRRPGRPWWPRGLPLRAAAAAPPAWTAPVLLAWRRRRRRRRPTWDIGRRGRISDETMKLGDSRG